MRRSYDSNMQSLPRQSIELYLGIAIALAQWALNLWGIVMNLWLGCALWIGITGLFIDIVWRSQWTVAISMQIKFMLTFVVIALMVGIAWKPVGSQYVKRNSDASAPFAVTLELGMGAPDNGYVSRYWFMYSSLHGCTISPIDVLLFMRITNLKPTKTMITGYSVDFKNNDKWVRLVTMDTRAGNILFIGTEDGTGSAPVIGRTVNIPTSREKLLLTNALPNKSRYNRAALMKTQSLDSQLGDKYLLPNDSARGWAIFCSDIPVNLVDLRINIVDEFGKTFNILYNNAKDKGSDSDIMPHLMTVAQVVDVSKCHRQPYFIKRQ